MLVPVKRMADCNVKVRAKSDRAGLDIAMLKTSINPFAAITAEESMRLN